MFLGQQSTPRLEAYARQQKAGGTLPPAFLRCDHRRVSPVRTGTVSRLHRSSGTLPAYFIPQASEVNGDKIG